LLIIVIVIKFPFHFSKILIALYLTPCFFLFGSIYGLIKINDYKQRIEKGENIVIVMTTTKVFPYFFYLAGVVAFIVILCKIYVFS
jgi:hypothetical protein